MDGSSQLFGKAQPGERSDDVPLKDPLPMALNVPTPPYRPGDVPRFAPFCQNSRGLSRPDTLASFEELREHASGLICVLQDDNRAEAQGDDERPIDHAASLRLASILPAPANCALSIPP